MGRKGMGRGLLVLLINLWWSELFFEMEGAPDRGEMIYFWDLCGFRMPFLSYSLLAVFFLHRFDVPKCFRQILILTR